MLALKAGRSSGGIPKKWDTREKRLFAIADLRKEAVSLGKQALKMNLHKSGSKSEIKYVQS